MKSKAILRFYFKADDLNRAIDNLILASACRSASSARGVDCAEKILSLISVKDSLSELWGRIDSVMEKLGEPDRRTLKYYSALRCGISKLGEEEQREIRRAVIKFKRHAGAVERCAEGLRLVGEYYCLL